MSQLLAVILFVAVVAASIVTVGCFVFRVCRGRFPAWFYGLAFAWWWPVRKDSALTIAAALLDADDECVDWRWRGSLNRKYEHKTTGLIIKMDWEGWFDSLIIEGAEAAEDSWGVYSLLTSLGRWQRRKRDIEINKADRTAAEAVCRAYGMK